MNTYAVDFRVMVPEWDTVMVTASDRDEAEALGKERAQAAWPEGSDIEITKIEENA